MNATMTYDTGLEQLIPTQIIRALGQPLIITFQVATLGIKAKQIGSASAIYTIARNLGGSLGIAALGNLQSVRERFHSNHLVEKISLSNPITRLGN